MKTTPHSESWPSAGDGGRKSGIRSPWAGTAGKPRESGRARSLDSSVTPRHLTLTLTAGQKVQLAASAAGIQSSHNTAAMNVTVTAAAGAVNIRATDSAGMNRTVFAAAGKVMHCTVHHSLSRQI